jgi:hypothetical protein
VAVTLNAAEVAPVRVPELAARVYPVPALFTDSPENVATPWTTVTGPPPESVAPDGFVPKARVTASVLSVVTTFPYWSSRATRTAGLMVAPATAEVGCWRKPRCVAAAGVMVIPDTVPVIEPVDVSAAVRDWLPAVLRVIVNICAPPSAAVNV